MELNLSREDAALLPLFDLSAVVSDDWTTMARNICVSVLSTSAGVSYTSGRLSPPPDRVFKMAVDVYVVGALCLMGLVGNALSFVVLRCDDDVKHATSWLLRALAVVDAFYLVTCVLIQPLRTIHHQTDWLPNTFGHVYTRLEPFIWPLASIAHTITVWTVVLVTADRYAAVRWPCNKRLRSRLRARLSVLAVVTAAFIYNLPMFFEMKTVAHKNFCTGEMEVFPVRTALRHSRIYYVVYKTLCFLVFRTAGPLVALIVLNTRLICALKMARQRLKAANRRLRQTAQGRRRQRRTTNITLTLVVVVSVFIVCELPDLGLRSAIAVLEFTSDRRQADINILRHGNTVTNALLAFNSSVNFIIYCLVGKKFRDILIDMLYCRRGGAESRRQHYIATTRL